MQKKGLFHLNGFCYNYRRLGGFTEWKVLYALCKDKDGFLHKDTVRAVYDGSLFERMEQETKAKESAKKK
jgi:peroxygenase